MNTQTDLLGDDRLDGWPLRGAEAAAAAGPAARGGTGGSSGTGGSNQTTKYSFTLNADGAVAAARRDAERDA